MQLDPNRLSALLTGIASLDFNIESLKFSLCLSGPRISKFGRRVQCRVLRGQLGLFC